MRQDILGSVLEELGGLREPIGQHPSHVVKLGHRGGVIGLGED
jgi:hypothetical protein